MASAHTVPATQKQSTAARIGVLFAVFFGAGYSPIAPGTAGSAAALVLFLLLWPAGLSPLWLIGLSLALLPAAAWAAGRCEERVGGRDPGIVVLDEVLGQWIALAAVPAGAANLAGWKYWLPGFILFRIFDIVKPFPARRAEGLPGGWGIMADDYLAAAYAFIVLQGLVWWGW